MIEKVNPARLIFAAQSAMRLLTASRILILSKQRENIFRAAVALNDSLSGVSYDN
jgi:hypothetical protein